MNPAGIASTNMILNIVKKMVNGVVTNIMFFSPFL